MPDELNAQLQDEELSATIVQPTMRVQLQGAGLQIGLNDSPLAAQSIPDQPLKAVIFTLPLTAQAHDLGSHTDTDFGEVVGRTDGDVVTWDGDEGMFVLAPPTGGGAIAFLDLTDTPDAYTGSDGKYVRVLGAELVFDDAVGLQGEQGEPGAQGLQGDQGIQGIQGEQGIQGIQGVQGDEGPQGDPGMDGLDGDDGLSAYEVAVVNGFVGTEAEWLESLIGETGAEGPQGDTGPTGATGSTGATGATGPQGGFGGDSQEYLFNASLSDADPSPGYLKINNATFASVTFLYVDDLNFGGTDMQTWYATFDDSTNTIKGAIRIFLKSDSNIFRTFLVTGVTEATGYWKIAVTPISASGTLTEPDPIVMSFVRAGNVGDTGATGSQGIQGDPGADGDAADMAAETSAASTDDSIADADLFGRVTGGVWVKTTWGNIKTTLTTFLDAIYGRLSVANTWTQSQTIASTQADENALRVIRNLSSTATDSPVVDMIQDHASDDQAVLRVQQDGTGAIVEFYDGATLVLRATDGGRLEVAQIIRALTSSGLRLEDDGGNLGVFIEDGGYVGILHNAPDNALHIKATTTNANDTLIRVETTNSGGAPALQVLNDLSEILRFIAWGSAVAGSSLGEARAGKAMLTWAGTNPLVIGTNLSEIALVTADVRRLIIDASGNINIGNDPAGVNQFNVGGPDAFGAIRRYIANAFGPGFVFAKSRHATVGSHTIVQNGDILGTFSFQGSNGSAFVTAAQFRVLVDGTPGASDMPGRFEILITPDGSVTPAIVVTVNDAGLVMASGKKIVSSIVEGISDLTLRTSTTANSDVTLRAMDGIYFQNQDGTVTYGLVNATAFHILEKLRATTSAGLRIEDDAGNLGVFVEDGGKVGLGGNVAPVGIVQVTTGGLSLDKLNALTDMNADTSGIWTTNGAVGGLRSSQGTHLVLQARSSALRDIIFVTNQLERMTVFGNGLVRMAYNAEVLGEFEVGQIIRAATASGIRLEDDDGNLGISILDGGRVGAGVVPTTNLGVKAGSSSNDAAVGGLLYSYANATGVGNVGAGEDQLVAYSVPGSTLINNGQKLRFRARGSRASSANAKTLRVRLDGQLVDSVSMTTGSPGRWELWGEIIRTGATTQMGCASYIEAAVTSLSTYAALTRTLANALVLEITGEATTTGDIILNQFDVYFEDYTT